MTVEEANRLLAEAEAKQSARDQALGALAEIRKQIKDQFGCKSDKDVAAKLKQLARERDDAQRRAETALGEYQRRSQAPERGQG